MEEGFEFRFGLIEVDFEIFERRLRGSVYFYGEIVRMKKFFGEEDL